jgi:Uma2 family endonuclease
MPVSDELYEQVALADPEHQWELHRGELVRKPAMTMEHDYLTGRLARILGRQLDMDQFDVADNRARLRVSSGRHYVPDVCVVPVEFIRRRLTRSPRLAIFDEPMPLVVEVWSPSTGDYDVESKLPEYQQRGDQEIWLLHPYDRMLTAWRRQPDGSYATTRYTSGAVEVGALPEVVVQLQELFAMLGPAVGA